MPGQVSWETCSNIRTFGHPGVEFSAIQQIPAHFKIKSPGIEKSKAYKLEGQPAPAWKLREIYSDSVALNELEHKVILIQFTGFGCGACHTSIPFLKQLALDKGESDFEILTIETWSKNINGIERYKDKNGLNNRFLVAGQETSDDYGVQVVPAFFTLDKNKIIKKVIVGYGKNVTDKEVVDIIDGLL